MTHTFARFFQCLRSQVMETLYAYLSPKKKYNGTVKMFYSGIVRIDLLLNEAPTSMYWPNHRTPMLNWLTLLLCHLELLANCRWASSIHSIVAFADHWQTH